jgi:hypothetical protein
MDYTEYLWLKLIVLGVLAFIYGGLRAWFNRR